MKLKGHRGAAKRFRITKKGKILMRRAGKRHLLTDKSRRRKRNLRDVVSVHPAEKAALRRLLPFGRP